MTFEQFKAGRVKVADVAVAYRWTDSSVEGEPVLSQSGWVYPTGLFITDVGHDWPESVQREGAHHLVMGNEERVSDDLDALERILFASYETEIAEDELAAGNAASRAAAEAYGLRVNPRIAAAGLA